MRLTEQEVHAIKRAATLTFGPDAVVRVYGSRAFDDRRGGDIDLHIETAAPIDFWEAKDEFLERLFARIDRQRVDVISSVRDGPVHPIEQIAYRDGVIL